MHTRRSNTRRIWATISGAALAGTLLTAAPAHADRYENADPAGDMARGFQGVAAPGGRHLDIRHVTVRHTDHFVSIRAHVRSLTRPRGNDSFALLGFIKVNKSAQPSESTAWTYEVEFDRRRPRVGDRLFILDAEHQEEFGCDGFTDSGLKARANYDRDRVTLIIPRRCLALSDDDPDVRPNWVQVTVTTLDFPFYDHLGPRARYFAGDQFNSSHHRWLTPRLYAG